MPVLERNGTEIHYDVYGEGYPLLLFAPGGMNSSPGCGGSAPVRLASACRG